VRPWTVMAVMIRRALDTLPSVVEGFLCRETDVSYVLKPDTAPATNTRRPGLLTGPFRIRSMVRTRTYSWAPAEQSVASRSDVAAAQ
jgi:hypothetical protein